MALLNPSPVLALPITMWLAYQEIARHPGAAADAVVDALCPPIVRAIEPARGADGKDGMSPKPATTSVAQLKSLGVLEPSSEGYRLAAPAVGRYADFVDLLRQRVFDPANCALPTDGDLDKAPGTADIVVALGWFLTQDPYSGWDWARAEVSAPAGTFANNTRWNGFQDWSVALGLAEPTVLGGSGIVPNPTRAIGCMLRRPVSGPPIETGQELPIRALVDFLRREIPVVPGGRLSRPDGEPDQPDVMAATSFALLCAEQYGWIRMTSLSDAAEILNLVDPDSTTQLRTVSHFTYLGEVEGA